MNRCNLCPRECGADRNAGKKGICGVSGKGVIAARAALHMWEEPCISGGTGSGAVFFCGCPLRCVYCQNAQISAAKTGKEISVNRLSEIFLELQEMGAANINLVTPTHYTPEIITAVEQARANGLRLPIVYNCSGYERVETLESLSGIVDIYLTDFKYMEPELAARYSKAPDYPQVAMAALTEMVRQTGAPVFDDEKASAVADGQRGNEEESSQLLRKGVIVRHLLLPGHVKNAKSVIRYVYETYGNQVILSLMNQYTPLPQVKENYPEIGRRVTDREYKRMLDYAISIGVENAFVQVGKTAEESFIPAFDGEGL